MSTQTDQLARAAEFAGCQVLGQGGVALMQAGAWSMATGGAGLVPFGIGAASLFASHYAGCWDTEAAPTVPVHGNGSAGRCTEVTGCGQVWIDSGNGWELLDDGDCIWQKWEATYWQPSTTPGLEVYWTKGTYCADGKTWSSWRGFPIGSRLELRPCDGGSCVTTSPGGGPEWQPIPYTDPDTGCQLIINMQGFAMFPGDVVRPVYKIEPAPVLPGNRATGGVIGNCNFAPVIYVPDPGDGGGGGDGPIVGPYPEGEGDGDEDEPIWARWLRNFLASLLADVVNDAIISAFEQPLPQYRYTMRAACEKKQDGTFEDYTITLPAQGWQERVLSMQEMQVDFLQQHLLWKTPTCNAPGKPLTGDPVTLNWISDEVSPASGTRLNKNLTYFDQSGSSHEETVAHWKDFVWMSGPVVVSCAGTPLGKPQVWAASEEEGKRVLEHAAQIAGVDLTDAEWLVGTPKDPRFGVPATMRILKRKGILGITKRSGPNGYPDGLPG